MKHVPGFVLAFVVGFAVCTPLAHINGKHQARRWHCDSQGYEEYRVTDRGTIECVKLTREIVTGK